jgi:hypothetical protein
VRLRGISRPSRHLKLRLTTQAGEISLEREITRPRVQAVAELGKTRAVWCPRTKGYQSGMLAKSL